MFIRRIQIYCIKFIILFCINYIIISFIKKFFHIYYHYNGNLIVIYLLDVNFIGLFTLAIAIKLFYLSYNPTVVK